MTQTFGLRVENKDDIFGILTDFVARESGFEQTDAIDTDTNWLESGLVDSVMIVSLVAFCEEQFDCTLDLEELTEEHLSSARALGDFIWKTLGH